MKYEPAFDGLRALAVTAVVAYHISPGFPGGYVGVDLFFVLSGYLITTILAAERADSGTIDLRRFYLKRAFRLFPALALVLLFELCRAALDPAARASILRAIGVCLLYVTNWARAFDLPGIDGQLGHSWSLSLEEQFYIVWPILLLGVFPRRPLVWLIAALAAVTALRLGMLLGGVSGARVYNGSDTHSDGLILGCIVALMPPSPALKRIASQTAPVALLGLAALVLFADGDQGLAESLWVSFAGVLSAWLLLAILHQGWLEKALSSGVLVYVGRVSYGWYLWHYPLYQAAHQYLPAWTPPLAALIALPVAMLSYAYVERPALRVRDRLIARGTPTPGDLPRYG